ncbi:MAG: glycosyltransferase family 4 protein [Candidatus Thermoplasmatota archaeon]|nr:glycosyltransferase family 4 protein [Candidatus Thermoplasmatota archaeon]
MRILQLCVRFPPAPGGAETHVHSISKELVKRGHDVTVFTSDLYTETPFVRLTDVPDTTDGIRVKRFRAHTMGGEMHYVLVPSLLWRSIREKVDVVHAHSYGYFHVNAAFLMRRLRGVPFVFTPHFHPEWSMWGGSKRKMLRRIYDRWLGSCIFDSADRIIGVSRAEMSLMNGGRFAEGRTTIIPNGISPGDFDPPPDGRLFREHYGLGGKVVLFVGRLASNKGLDTLVDSIPGVIAEHDDVKFVLVGQDEGMRESLLKRANSLGVSDALVFTGHITDDRLFRSAFASSDVFVLPSEYEAFGIVLLEAMMCEKPCIASAVGGTSEAVVQDETGLLVEYGNAGELAEMITGILSDPQKAKEMGKRGRERVLRKFTWERVAGEIEKVYEDLI